MKVSHVKKSGNRIKCSKQPLNLLSSDIKWKESIQFWREKFILKPFNAILLVQYKNPPHELGYDVISIFKWEGQKSISIDGCLADFAFKEFNPEKDYLRYAVVDFI